MNAEEHLRAGDVIAARAALADELKRDPSNPQARQFFWQLLAVQGDWDKARSQLRTLAQVQASALMLAQVYGQALAAEEKRHAVWRGEASPISLVGTEPWVEGLLQALSASIKGDPARVALREAALAAAPTSSGSWNDARFEWIADADTRIGPMLEVLVGEEHGFVPFATIARLRAGEPQDLRDTVWLPVDITLKSGQSASAFLPVVYHGTPADNGQLRLARGTEWQGPEGGESGLGQRLFATDIDDYGALSLRDVRFD